MGDGIFDVLVMDVVGYSIAPANADKNAINAADFVTERIGGNRAVSEACLHILKKFYGLKSFKEEINSVKKLNTGEWNIC